jgi:hypothetical protein
MSFPYLILQDGLLEVKGRNTGTAKVSWLAPGYILSFCLSELNFRDIYTVSRHAPSRNFCSPVLLGRLFVQALSKFQTVTSVKYPSAMVFH